MIAKETMQEAFKLAFPNAREPLIVRSPGRVNIIGEHTDYNEGFVLPAAIDKAAWVAVSKRNDGKICLYANEFKEGFETALDAMQPTALHWPNYIMGVADQLQKMGRAPGGFNMFIDGDIPIGAGLSSSAALECATAFALNEVFNLGLEREQLAYTAQKAEHEFVGLNCGIMDMFASLFGKKDYVISLDCRSLAYEYMPLQLGEYKLVLLNTNVKHNLSSSEYNLRRQQCEQGVAWLQEHAPQVKSLRDADAAMLEKDVLPKDALIYQRCKYVVDENKRLLQACEDLKQGDIAALGNKMFATHEGLSRDYGVSCAELDFLVNAVKGHDAVLGARMMGGGFGGCTINLVKEDAIPALVAEVAAKYQQELGLELSVYVATTGDGTALQ